MIPDEIIEEINTVSKIEEVVGEHLTIKKKGVNLVGLCPFHSEKSGSFTVSPSKGIYKCFGCGKSGNSVGFVMEFLNQTFVEAIKYLGSKYNVEIEDAGTPKEYIKPKDIKLDIDDKAAGWFNKRGIGRITLMRFKICSNKEYMPQTNKEENCILFKYYQDEELKNIKFRDGAKNFKLVSNAELIFYNVDAIENVNEAVITEGEIDCLSAYESGIHNVVSVPNGASKGTQRLEYLDNCIKYFANKGKVVIATDNDKAGTILRNELTRRLGADKCYHVTYPSDCKDLNDVLVKHGKDKVKEVVDSAKQPPVVGILTLEDVEKDLNNLYKNGFPSMEGIGYYEFDEKLRFFLQRVTTITAVPNSGKTDWLDQVLVRLANRSGWRHGIFSPERQPAELHILKLMSVYLGKPFIDTKGIKKFDEELYQLGKEWAKDHFFFYNINESNCTIDGILEKGEELVRRMGINSLTIDPYNYIESARKSGQSETEYVSETYGKIKMFAHKFSVHCFIIAHPTKMDKDSNGHFKVPNLYSISGSANFFNKTDNGLAINRNEETGYVEAHIQKVKYSWEGRKGIAEFRYDIPTARYSSVMGEFEEEYKYKPQQTITPPEPVQIDVYGEKEPPF